MAAGALPSLIPTPHPPPISPVVHAAVVAVLLQVAWAGEGFEAYAERCVLADVGDKHGHAHGGGVEAELGGGGWVELCEEAALLDSSQGVPGGGRDGGKGGRGEGKRMGRKGGGRRGVWRGMPPTSHALGRCMHAPCTTHAPCPMHAPHACPPCMLTGSPCSAPCWRWSCSCCPTPPPAPPG